MEEEPKVQGREDILPPEPASIPVKPKIQILGVGEIETENYRKRIWRDLGMDNPFDIGSPFDGVFEL